MGSNQSFVFKKTNLGIREIGVCAAKQVDDLPDA